MRASLPAGFLISTAIALPAMALVFGLPTHPAILDVLNNFAHGPVFGLFAVVLVLLLRDKWSVELQYLGGFAVAALLGGVIEWVQPFLGREGSLQDWLFSVLGAAAGLAVLALATTRRRWLPGSVLAISVAALSWPVLDAALGYVERTRQVPSLLELSGRGDWYFLSFDGFQVSASRLPDRWRRAGDPDSIRLKLTDEPRRFISHSEPLADWHGYRRLMVDLTNPGSAPLELTLRVHDRTHDNQASDRFNKRFRLEPATRSELAIALSDVSGAPQYRTLDLSHIAGWMIFAGGDAALTGREFYLTRVWLE